MCGQVGATLRSSGSGGWAWFTLLNWRLGLTVISPTPSSTCCANGVFQCAVSNVRAVTITIAEGTPARPAKSPPDPACNNVGANATPHEGHAASPEDSVAIFKVCCEVLLLNPAWSWAQVENFPIGGLHSSEMSSVLTRATRDAGDSSSSSFSMSVCSTELSVELSTTMTMSCEIRHWPAHRLWAEEACVASSAHSIRDENMVLPGRETPAARCYVSTGPSSPRVPQSRF